MSAEVASAERLLELLQAALQSHSRLEAIELEFEAKLEAYWADVQKNIDHGVELARLEWVKVERRSDLEDLQLRQQNGQLRGRITRALAKADRALAANAGLRAANAVLKKKLKAKGVKG